jgi:hypothetical protein
VTAATTFVHTRATPAASSVLAVLGGAAALALAGDLLFKGATLGLNVFVWVAGLAAWATFLARGHSLVRPTPDAWQLPAVLLAAMFALRDNDALLALDFLAMALALGLPLLRARGLALRTASLTAYAAAATRAALHALLGWAPFLFLDVPWDRLSRGHAPRRAGPVLAGLALGAPLLLLFAALFSAADPVFESAADTLLSVDLGPWASHAVIMLGFGALATGYLRGRLWGERVAAAPGAALRAPAVGEGAYVTIATATGAMVLVFLLFVALQARYLVGGAAFVRDAAGLTLAEYARRGFFESVVACGLSLPVLLAGDWLLGKQDARAKRSFHALGAVQAGLIGVVLLSAMERLRLYVSAFGLTEDRIFGVAGLVWLAATTGWFQLTVTRGRRERFAFGAVVAGFAALGALNAANPDALVARVNLARAEQGRELDYTALARLSSDATPVIARRIEVLRDDVRCSTLAGLAEIARAESAGDWRGFKLSRYLARRAVQRAWDERPGCAAPPDAGL